MSTKTLFINRKQYIALRKRFGISRTDGPTPGVVHVHMVPHHGTLQIANFGDSNPFSRQITWDATKANMARALATLFGGNTEDYMLQGVDEA